MSYEEGAKMNLYIVVIEEWAGWECNGHDISYFVWAHNEDEAKLCVPESDREYILTIRLFKLPRFSRARTSKMCLVSNIGTDCERWISGKQKGE